MDKSKKKIPLRNEGALSKLTVAKHHPKKQDLYLLKGPFLDFDDEEYGHEIYLLRFLYDVFRQYIIYEYPKLGNSRHENGYFKSKTEIESKEEWKQTLHTLKRGDGRLEGYFPTRDFGSSKDAWSGVDYIGVDLKTILARCLAECHGGDKELFLQKIKKILTDDNLKYFLPSGKIRYNEIEGGKIRNALLKFFMYVAYSEKSEKEKHSAHGNRHNSSSSFLDKERIVASASKVRHGIDNDTEKK